MEEQVSDQSLSVLPEQIGKRERRELKKQAEEERRAGFERSLRRSKFFRRLIIFAVAAVLLILAYRWVRKSEAEQPGEVIAEQPAEHIKPGDPIPGLYLSNPPVSGWHYSDPAEWGVYDHELPDQTLIHNLEHGGIWISYKPDAPQEVVDGIKRAAGKFKRKVIVTPRAANDSMIALAAWGRLDKFDYLDEARILKFIKAYKDKGPEFVP